jgi:hypothetical protein
MSISTQAVLSTSSGTSFTIDVTNANLSANLAQKDFVVLDNTNEVFLDNQYFTKSNSTTLAYSGPDVGIDVSLEVRRVTPVARYQEAKFANRFDPEVYNTEVDNILRALFEYQLFNSNASTFSKEPLNTEYGPEWALDSERSRTANRLYAILETLAPYSDPVFAGTVELPSASDTIFTGGQTLAEYVTGLVNAAQAAAVEAAYPVGSIYANASVTTNPATLLGFGTWVRFGQGRVMVGQDPSDDAFNGLEETGGSKTHTLTEAQLAAHAHEPLTANDFLVVHGNFNQPDSIDGLAEGVAFGPADVTRRLTTASTGSGEPFSILPPYVVVYLWKRTA